MDRGYESLYAVKIAYYRHKWLHCKSQTVRILKCWPCAAVVVYFVQEKYFVIPTTNWLSYIWTLLLTFFSFELSVVWEKHIWAWTKNCKLLLLCKVIFVAHIKHCRRNDEPFLWFNWFITKLEHFILTRAFKYMRLIFIILVREWTSRFTL